MKERTRKQWSPRRPAAAALAGLLAVSLLPAAATAALAEEIDPGMALVVASVLFSALIGFSSRYSLVYGSLASLIILMLWLYLCSTIVILGACFDRAWYGRIVKKSKS